MVSEKVDGIGSDLQGSQRFSLFPVGLMVIRWIGIKSYDFLNPCGTISFREGHEQVRRPRADPVPRGVPKGNFSAEETSQPTPQLT